MFSRKNYRWLPYVVCLVFAACSEITVYEAQAGIMSPPPGAGQVQVSTSHQIDTETSSSGAGQIFGNFIPRNTSGNIWVNVTGDPDRPGTLVITAQSWGDDVTTGAPLTGLMLALGDNPQEFSVNLSLNEVRFGNGGWVEFDHTVRVELRGRSSFYYDQSGYRAGVVSANVMVQGGLILNSYGELNHNIWDGDGPRPNWLHDIEAAMFWNATITQPGTVHYVPEPANAAVTTLLGLASLGFRRR